MRGLKSFVMDTASQSPKGELGCRDKTGVVITKTLAGKLKSSALVNAQLLFGFGKFLVAVSSL